MSDLLKRYIYFPEKANVPEITGNKAIVETLKAYKVKYFFGLPGITEGLFAELHDAASEIRTILPRNEKCGAYMADGYAKASYSPGVCTGCEGPGATNLVTPLAESYFSSTPVIALTAARPTTEIDRNPLMFCRGMDDTLDLLKPLTKWSIRVVRVHQVAEMLRKAFRIATTGRPGPVQVQFYADVLSDKWPIEILSEEEFTKYPAMRVAPGDRNRIVEAAKLLVNAERPVIIAGEGAMISQAWDEIIELAELLVIPVAVDCGAAKGIIPENHPLSIGKIGTCTRESAAKIVEEADLVVFIGSKAGVFETSTFKLPNEVHVRDGKTQIIQIHVDPNEIGKTYLTKVGIASDEKLALKELLAVLKTIVKTQPKEESPRFTAIQRIVKEWEDAVAPLKVSDHVPIKPQRLLKEIRDFLLKDDILVSGFGNVSAFLNIYYETLTAGRKVIAPTGYGSVGWGFPAAIGVKLAAPHKKVLALVGDGGFGFHIGELETAKRENIPLVTVILNNLSFGAEKDFFTAYYDKRYAGVDFSDVDYGKVAEAFGCYGVRVERPGEIREALDSAFKSGKPGVIDVLIDTTVIPPYRWFSPEFRGL